MARKRVPTILNYMLLTVVSIIMMGPFVWMVLSSLKPSNQIITYPPTILPHPATFTHYREVWNIWNFKLYLVNSCVYTIITTFLVILTSALAGYVFAKFDFRFKEFLFMVFLAGMMIPFYALMIPLYLLMVRLGWVNTLAALIIPAIVSPFGIFLMRQFMHGISSDYIGAARIDGCSELGIFVRIILPLAKPALTALTIFTFTAHWDNFVWPLIVINSEKKFTLPLALAFFAGERFTDYGPTMAAATITVLPIILVFLLFQRNFIEGIALTGLKG